ncbi:unnamed protein product [Spirodela intermedia]|uniref:Uncharacterized protein n=1 Tax=Spirodela intermedia TaxID=51605 RepID=A0A7I8IAA6_SPIIN|nr:unnamed protein product [Spirodela intermedia]CAA6654656.1 unnamed protein product [Spirodela intermedia]
MKRLPYSESSAERAADHTPIQLSTAGASGEIASRAGRLRHQPRPGVTTR